MVATRAPQPLRQRRESQRAANSKNGNKAITMDSARVPVKSKILEPRSEFLKVSRCGCTMLTRLPVKTTEFILNKFKGKPPSLILHLHPTHFRFDQQDGSFAYNSPMKVFLEHVKSQTVPHDMLEELFQSDVSFYDGMRY